MKVTLQALLNSMEVGEEIELPLFPSVSMRERKRVLQKLNDKTFLVSPK